MQAAATVLTAVYLMNLGPLVLLPLVLEKKIFGELEIEGTGV